jgi:dUTP pyrophosphatase
MLKIETKIVNPILGHKVPLPFYSTDGSAGIDIRACLNEPLTVAANETQIIPSGFAINISDPKIMAVLVPRSGLGIKCGIVLANLVGIIDSDYHGEIQVGIWNRSNSNFIVCPGDRICQMIFVPILQVRLDIVTEFSPSQFPQRGIQGLGHSGIQ